MPVNVHAALRRFRRRLRLRAFATASTFAATSLAVAGAAVLVTMHLTDHGLPGWLASSWRGPAVAVLAVLAAALLWGWLRAARLRIDDARLCEHLEQRLGTGGLLLVAGEGVQLPEPFAARLAGQLQRVDAALPSVDAAARVRRPTLALLLLLGATMLPVPVARNGGGVAAAVAVAKLDRRVEALAEDARVPEDVREELQAAVQDLERRADGGEDDLWREIDQLTERVDREVAGLAAAGARNGDSGGGGGEATSGEAAGGQAAARASAQRARAGQVAEAMRLLKQLVPEVGEWLPEPVRQLLDDARDEHGAVDAERLAADPRWTPEAAEQVAAALASSLEAAASGDILPELAEQAEQLAAELAEAAPGPSPGDSRLPLTPEQAQQLMRSVAEGACTLAELGKSADGLAALLQEALAAGALQLAEGALEHLDIEALMDLLPDDPQQLRALADQLAELARAAAQAQSPSAAGSPSGQLGEAAAHAARGLSAEQRAGLQQLAERLAGAAAAGGAAGSQSGSPPGNSSGSPPGGASAQPGGAPAGGAAGAGGASSGAADGASGVGAAGASNGNGGPARGPGHAALRMTEHATGEARGELELPTPLAPEQLSREWRPVDVQKAAPEVGAPHGVEPGAATAAGGSGAATWQLRLMPRHRAVVQRFFGGDDPPAPASGGQRGDDKK